MESDKIKLRFVINNHDFLEKNESSESFDKFEYLFDVAPVYYLSSFYESVPSSLDKYAHASKLGLICYQELKYVNSLDNLNEYDLCNFYKIQSQIDELIRITSDIFDLFEINNLGVNDLKKFVNKIPSYDMSVFTQKTILNVIYSIFGMISKLSLLQNITLKDENLLRDYITQRYWNIIVYLKKTEHYEKLKIVIDSCKSKVSIRNFYLSVISNDYLLKNNKDKIVDSIKIALNEITRILSSSNFKDQNYLLELNEIIDKFSKLKNFSKYTDNQHRCFAIIHKDSEIYFSLSGCLDIHNKIHQVMESFQKEINTALFDGKAKWCFLSENTLKYVDEIPNGFAYLPSSIQFKNDLINPDLYSCCERKIFGLYPNIDNFKMFVFFSPCYRCTPALSEKKCEIVSFIDYNKFTTYYNVQNFSPKHFEIKLINNIFTAIEKK